MSQPNTPWQEFAAQDVVPWTPVEPPQAVEGPLALDLFRDRVLALDLAPGQVAVHVVNERTHRVYLDGQHQLVLDGSPDGTEATGWLTFLRDDTPIGWRWDDSSHLRLGDGPQPAASLPLRGACSLLIADPVRFHDAVLSGLAEVPDPRLAGVLATLVCSQLEARLQDLAGSQSLDPLQAKVQLEALTPADLDDDLDHLGLRCAQLTLAIPVAQESTDESVSETVVACFDDVL